MRALKQFCCAAALVALVAPGAHADEWNKKTFFTFSGPVQVPGATLPAGTYTFKLADLNGNRHVVQIFDKDENKIFTTILAIPDQRLQPADEPLVLFAERKAGTPQAVKAWFYPGDTIGNEFVYPKDQAVTIAKATHQSVLATNDTSNDREHMKSSEIGRVNENGEMTSESHSATTTTAENRAQPPATTAPPATTTAPSRDDRLKDSSGNVPVATTGQSTARAPRRSLPATGSDLPLVGLLSVFSMIAGFGVHVLRRRLADVR